MWAARSLAAALALFVFATPALAQGIDDLNRQALEAFQAGDMTGALDLAEAALAVDEAEARANAEAYLWAHNNRIFLLGETGADPEALLAATTPAVAFADRTGTRASVPGLNVSYFHVGALHLTGRQEAAVAALAATLAAARRTERHGATLPTAVDTAFAIGDYANMVDYIEEMLAVTGRYGASTRIDALYARQEEMEAAEDIEAVGHLIRARILIAYHVVPEADADVFAHTALYRLFTMNYFAGNYGAAADALAEWAQTGEVTEDERAQMAGMAEGFLTLAQGRAYSADSTVGLGYAQMTVAITRAVHPADDPRLALALRERAAAEGAVGQYDRAAATLQEALAVAEAGEAAPDTRAFLLADLAMNAWQRGDADLAAELHARSDAILAGHDVEMSAVDRLVEATNRAKVALERGDAAGTQAWIARARDALAEAGDLAPDDRPHRARLAEVVAMAAQATGTAPLDAARRWAEAVRAHYPETHADRALALYNAADHLYALGDRPGARTLLSEAEETAAQSLPRTAPLNANLARTRAVDALLGGDRDTARDRLAAAVEIYRAPENRDELAEAAFDFELYAWLLLDAPSPPRADVDAALRALQWTQVNRAAEAVSRMETRLSQTDPSLALLLRARQDAREDIARLRSEIALAYAGDLPLDGLFAREARAARALEQAEDALAASDLSLAARGTIRTLGLDDIQARLAPGEVFVTFNLPGLDPRVVPGLDGSANHAIAITAEAVTVGPVRTIGRARLRDRVAAFRCEMAVSDAGCGTRFRSALFRGAMLPPGSETQDDLFDWDLAHGLYRDLFGGIETALAGAETLIIAPSGDLLNLPFAALVSAPGPHDLATAPWLIRDHAVSVLPSIPAFATLRDGGAPAGSTRFLGVGDPLVGRSQEVACGTMDLATLRGTPGTQDVILGPVREGIRLAAPAELRKMERLADTACEVEAMRDAVGGGEVMLREAATERAIKARDADGTLAGYDVITFATHGLITGERGAAAPGLVLTPPEVPTLEDDGLLTSAEIATLTLSARLVVLSACNTAAGEAPGQEGLSGLAGSLFHAGARALLVTHWSVYSDASARIASGLVGRLAADPAKGNAAALRDTVLDVIDGATRPLERHPSYWAPFAVIGA